MSSRKRPLEATEATSRKASRLSADEVVADLEEAMNAVAYLGADGLTKRHLDKLQGVSTHLLRVQFALDKAQCKSDDDGR